jgi:anti-anti-sigma factor
VNDVSGHAPLRADVSEAGVRTTVRLRGELDLATAPVLAATVRPYAREGCRELVVDVSELTFLDCAGITVLVELADALAAQQPPGRVVVRNPVPIVRRVLDITGVLADGTLQSDGTT